MHQLHIVSQTSCNISFGQCRFTLTIIRKMLPAIPEAPSQMEPCLTHCSEVKSTYIVTSSQFVMLQ